MHIERKWSMPNANTFSIFPIKEFIEARNPSVFRPWVVHYISFRCFRVSKTTRIRISRFVVI